MTRSREHGSDWKRGRAKRGSDAFLKSGGGCCACGWEPYGCGRGGAGQRSGGVALEHSFRFLEISLSQLPLLQSFSSVFGRGNREVWKIEEVGPSVA